MQMKYEPITVSEVQKLFVPGSLSSIHNMHLEGLEIILNMQTGDFNGKSIFKIEPTRNNIFRLHCNQSPIALAAFMEKLNPIIKIGKTIEGFFIDFEQSFVLRLKFKLCELNLDCIPERVLCKVPSDLEKEHLAAINFCFAQNSSLQLEFRKTHFDRQTKESSGPLKSILFKLPLNTKQEDFSALVERLLNDLGSDILLYSGISRDQNRYCFELHASLLKDYYQHLINVAFVKSAVELSQSQLLSTSGFFNSKVVDAPAAKVPVEIPDQFLCPITMEIMKEPVIIEDGYTYEKIYIEKALGNKAVSPMTQVAVNPNVLIPNRALKDLIEKFIMDNPVQDLDVSLVPK